MSLKQYFNARFTMKAMIPVLFIPGLACNHTMWRHQIAALARHTKVFTADLPATDCLIEMTAIILRAAPERFHCVGSSMGGYIALEIMRQAPERVETLSLLVTTPEPDTEAVAGRRQDLQESVRRGEWQSLWRSITPRFVSAKRKGDTALVEAFVDQISETCPQAFLLHQTAMMVRPSYVEILPQIRCATNVIIGEDDIIIPPKIQEAMADKIPGAVKTYIPDCGHIPSMEKPQEVAQILNNWVFAYNAAKAA